MSLDLRALNEGHDRSYGVVLLNWVTVWDSGCPETVELCSEVRSAPAVIAIDVHLRKKFFEPLANSERCNIPMIELDIDMVAPREGRFNPPRARAHWDLLATHPGLEAQQVGFSPPWHGRVLELYPSNAHQAN
ncbi:MAG: hypothetical protein NT062_10775 [Proteobacteria bacterium]|nr:hypothetical protein [Pseudomonadota bacterium]